MKIETTALALLKEMVESIADPFVASEMGDGGYCVCCGKRGFDDEHEPGCVWLRAKTFLEDLPHVD